MHGFGRWPKQGPNPGNMGTKKKNCLCLLGAPKGSGLSQELLRSLLVHGMGSQEQYRLAACLRLHPKLEPCFQKIPAIVGNVWLKVFISTRKKGFFLDSMGFYGCWCMALHSWRSVKVSLIPVTNETRARLCFQKG